MFDLVVRGGTVVTPAGAVAADVGVTDGAIAAIGLELAGREEVDARGLHVLPGGLDPHVHFNEPGRAHWEGFATGTAALAAGGFTAFFDMPLNSSPPVVDGAAFDAKLQAARASARVDYGFWGGLVPGNAGALEDLSERGVIGFKAFMSNSGIDEFALADDITLYEGMAVCARLGKLVAVHAENDALTQRPAPGSSARAFMASRPVVAEVEAIGRAITFAEDTGCSLHVVHVSSARGVELVAEARTRGVDVTCETCPHYLWLSQHDVETLGAVAKCAPPVRPDAERARLWQLVRGGAVDLIASDHSPAPPDLKAGRFANAWGGIASCQTTLTLLLSEGDLALEQVARLVAGGAARRFGMPRKGRIEVGADADLALVDLADERTLAADELEYRHPLSPWLGRRLHARVTRTLLRGREAWPRAEAEPRLLTPSL